MTRLGDDVVGSFQHGRLTGIDGTARALSTASLPATRGVQVKADDDNTGLVYVGGPGVTAGTAAATDGYPLQAGEGLFLPIDDAAKVFTVSPLSGQSVYFVVA